KQDTRLSHSKQVACDNAMGQNRSSPKLRRNFLALHVEDKLNLLYAFVNGVAAKIGAGVVARLANIPDIRFAGRLAITNFGGNAHVFHHVRGS
ncbi:MAG TPA: hypothetical protein VGQ54_01700, partial [Burkholderiales bacterium]|nr:hypothetical protein [Burkholderiales bacterium]